MVNGFFHNSADTSTPLPLSGYIGERQTIERPWGGALVAIWPLRRDVFSPKGPKDILVLQRNVYKATLKGGFIFNVTERGRMPSILGVYLLYVAHICSTSKKLMLGVTEHTPAFLCKVKSQIMLTVPEYPNAECTARRLQKRHGAICTCEKFGSCY